MFVTQAAHINLRYTYHLAKQNDSRVHILENGWLTEITVEHSRSWQ